MSILSNEQIRSLKQKAIYWREVLGRDQRLERQRILVPELENVVHTLGAEKILHIIAEHVESLDDPPPLPPPRIITRRAAQYKSID